MYNNNCVDGDNSSFCVNVTSNTSIHDFSPIASSSQHFPSSVNAMTCDGSSSNKTQIESIWSKYIKPIETDEGITLTQLSDLASGNSHWTSKAWKHAHSIYHNEMALFTVSKVTSQMKMCSKQPITILVVVIIRKEHPRKNSNVTLLLRDETGDIKATVSEELCKKYSLVLNSVIVLRNIQILTITNQVFPLHLIMINCNCIEAVFAPNEDHKNYLGRKEILTGLTQLQTHANKKSVDYSLSKSILVNKYSKREVNQRQMQTSTNSINELDELQFVCPDLDMDLDLPLNIDNDIPWKKQKLESSLLGETQLSTVNPSNGLLHFEESESLSTNENLTSVMNKIGEQQEPCAKSTFDCNVHLDSSRNIVDSKLGVKPKKPFKFMKNINIGTKVSTILTKPSMFEDTEGVSNDLFTSEKNKTQLAFENEIVKDVFKNIDVSCFFADF